MMPREVAAGVFGIRPSLGVPFLQLKLFSPPLLLTSVEPLHTPIPQAPFISPAEFVTFPVHGTAHNSFGGRETRLGTAAEDSLRALLTDLRELTRFMDLFHGDALTEVSFLSFLFTK